MLVLSVVHYTGHTALFPHSIKLFLIQYYEILFYIYIRCMPIGIQVRHIIS